MKKIDYNGTTFNVGDDVKIVRKVDFHHKDGMGKGKEWINSWTGGMDAHIGKTGKIESINPRTGVVISCVSYYDYPLMALELVQKRKFKVGDIVRCVNSMGHSLLEGEKYVVSSVVEFEGEYIAPAVNVVNKDGGSDIYGYEYRFELAEDTKPAPNGVDAQGNPLHFTQEDLKVFMRVERTEGTFGIYVGNVEHEGHCVVGDFNNGSTWTSEFDVDEDIGKYAETIAVYEAPYNVPDYLDGGKLGNLIWKRTPPKTAEQLAQEAAVATRNTAIEEAEKALKQAQERLEALKGM